LRHRYQLTILGTPPAGLMDTAGFFLDGAGTGQQGSNYVTVISDKLLVPPYTHKAGKQSKVHGDDSKDKALRGRFVSDDRSGSLP
jgi:hypothetical protein